MCVLSVCGSLCLPRLDVLGMFVKYRPALGTPKSGVTECLPPVIS